MPLHDWTRVDAGTYHDFHQGWTIHLRDTLNSGVLPSGYFAMADQRVKAPEPDVVTYDRRRSDEPSGGLAVAERPPQVKAIRTLRTAAGRYAQKANRLAIREGRGKVVAIIEIVSPGNKGSHRDFDKFAGKLVDFLEKGVNVLLLDPFPPTARDPQGLHEELQRRIGGDPQDDRPPGKPLTGVAYDAGGGEEITAYFEPLAVGDPLPSLPLFLEPDWYVPTPLEASYQAAWRVTPEFIRQEVETPVPQEEA